MRVHVYVSDAVGVNHLSQIINTAKSNNRKNKITGILSYKNGCYMQVIEGHEVDVEQLVFKLRGDHRHKNVQTILDFVARGRYFPNWDMKLAPLLFRDKSFKDLISKNIEAILALDKSLRERVNIFFPIDSLVAKGPDSPAGSSDSRTELKRTSRSYSINSWPNFSEIDPNPRILSLCGTLLNNPTSIKDLFQTGIFDDLEELKAALKLLKSQDCLVVSQLDVGDSVKKKETEIERDSSDKSFFKRMKNFLNTRLM